jgi:hypothetical protein
MHPTSDRSCCTSTHLHERLRCSSCCALLSTRSALLPQRCHQPLLSHQRPLQLAHPALRAGSGCLGCLELAAQLPQLHAVMRQLPAAVRLGLGQLSVSVCTGLQ